MSGFVYVWRDRLRGMYYVGSHWGREDDGYQCSSPWLKRTMSRRPEDFRRRVVARVSTSRQDLLDEETRWLQMIREDEIKPNTMTPRYYNLNRRAWHWVADPQKAKTIGGRISAAKMGIKPEWVDPEQRAARISATKQADRAKVEADVDLTRAKELILSGASFESACQTLGVKSHLLRDMLRRDGFVTRSARRVHLEKQRTERPRKPDKVSQLWADPSFRERTCPHCGKVGAGGVMSRWHFDNCRQRG